MFERFTDRARRVIVFAQEEARRHEHSYIGTEHLLLGLCREGDGTAAQTLAAFSVSAETVRQAVIDVVGPGTRSPAGHIPFTPRSKKILELSLREALQLGHNYIGTEHLLLGLIREGDSTAIRLLQHVGVDISALRSHLSTLLARGEGGDGPTLVGAGSSGEERRSDRGDKVLDQFGKNLTEAARSGELDPVIGRSKEMERMMHILARRTKNNPILIGEPGVGKSAIIEGLAQRIIDGEVPDVLRDKTVYTLDMGSLVAGARYRGDFEERLKKVVKEIKRRQDVLLFIDEIHVLVGAGAAEGAIDAASLIKPLLARGELQTIGATTIDEYRKHFEKDAALSRRFQPITVEPPSAEDAVAILEGLRPQYEEHHDVHITNGALRAAVDLSQRYLPDRHLPDKAIDLIDEAGSRLRMSRTDSVARMELTDETVAEVLAMWTGIPVTHLSSAEADRLIHMEDELHQRIIGQHDAVQAVSRSIRRTRAGLKDPKRPGGSFIFLGPTGVGKTELAKALAEFLFQDETALITLDMSEYMEKHAVSRLIGAPPGYVGFDEGGQLTEAVRRRPFSVVLLDEVEKAHPDVFNTLLQVLEDGRLTDSRGRVVDFRNTILIMTSNLGSSDLRRAQVGFTRDDSAMSYQRMCDTALGALKQHFRPEFLNRVDDVVVFKELSLDEITAMVDVFVGRIALRFAGTGHVLRLTDDARMHLAQAGYDPELGARPLRRVLQRKIEDLLAECLLDGSLPEGSEIVISVDGDSLVVHTEDVSRPIASEDSVLS